MTQKFNDIRVRIAPSPTGDPHVGTAYISLFNYAFAKKNNGKFILRIEDTDQKRSRLGSEQQIFNSLSWLGINWDEGPDKGGQYGPYRQSERLPIYIKYCDELIENKKAYRCTCTQERLLELKAKQAALKQPPGYDGFCKNNQEEVEKKIASGSSFVVRLKTPEQGKIVMNDLLRGEIVIDATEIDDQVLLKSDGFPTYHLANVVDDHLMRITHVIRGEEWISSLPKHYLLYDALSFEKPIFCHLPLLRNSDHSKVSKRKNPVSLKYYEQAGYLPESMINFLGLMAYTLPSQQEMFSLNEFVASFDLTRISLGGPVFDLKKLLWLNGRYLREQKSSDEYLHYIYDQLFAKEYMKQVIELVKERVEKSEDFINAASFFFTNDFFVGEEEILIGELNKTDSKSVYESILVDIESVDEWTAENIKSLLNEQIAKFDIKKSKNLFLPLRMVVTGKKASPPLFETIAVLGKERVRVRLNNALKQL